METATMTLAEFLEARLAEDETSAQAATAGPWGTWAGPKHSYVETLAAGPDFTVLVQSSPRGTDADIAHMARFDPARVLAEVAAKRAIIARHVPGDRNPNYSSTRGVSPTCQQCVSFHADMDCENEVWPCPTLRDLAAVYADHPDYREEWKS